MALGIDALIEKIKNKLESSLHETNDETIAIKIKQFIQDNFPQEYTDIQNEEKILSQNLHQFIKQNFPKNYAENNVAALTLWQLSHRRDEWLKPTIQDCQQDTTVQQNNSIEMTDPTIYQIIATKQANGHIQIETTTMFAHAIINNIEAVLAENLVRQLQGQPDRPTDSALAKRVEVTAGQEEFIVEPTEA